VPHARMKHYLLSILKARRDRLFKGVDL